MPICRIQDRSGALFFVCINQAFGGYPPQLQTLRRGVKPTIPGWRAVPRPVARLRPIASRVFGTVNAFPVEKRIVDRERTAGAYAVLPYYAAKWIAEFPFVALGPILFSCIVYWMIGFVNEASRFLTFVGIIVAINVVAVSWGMFMSAAAKSVQQAQAFAPLIVIVFLLFGGFYANTDNIPNAIAWISEVSRFARSGSA